MNTRHAVLYLLLGCVIFAVVLFGASPRTEAVPVSPGSWLEFSWTGITGARGCQPADPGGLGCTPSSGGNSSFVGAPAWTFANASPVILTVTDAFLAIDRFFVLDNAASLGPTSAPSNNSGHDCGSNPIPCLADPQISHGTFALDSGAHSLTLIQILNEDSGAGYFRLDTVPEPATLLLLGTTLTALGLMRSRKRRRRG